MIKIYKNKNARMETTSIALAKLGGGHQKRKKNKKQYNNYNYNNSN